MSITSREFVGHFTLFHLVIFVELIALLPFSLSWKSPRILILVMHLNVLLFSLTSGKQCHDANDVSGLDSVIKIEFPFGVYGTFDRII